MIGKLIATALLAVATGYDGSLPVYPHGGPAPGMPAAATAFAQGALYQQTTSDSVQTVDQWYKTHIPKSCSRTTVQSTVRYACPHGTIVIRYHGTTIIEYVPGIL
jgi:hypothetical protein